jgi:hypothetical protein
LPEIDEKDITQLIPKNVDINAQKAQNVTSLDELGGKNLSLNANNVKISSLPENLYGALAQNLPVRCALLNKGLTFMALYGIISVDEYNERVICIDNDNIGDDQYKLLDTIDRSFYVNNNYVIIRFPVNIALNVMLNYVNHRFEIDNTSDYNIFFYGKYNTESQYNIDDKILISTGINSMLVFQGKLYIQMMVYVNTEDPKTKISLPVMTLRTEELRIGEQYVESNIERIIQLIGSEVQYIDLIYNVGASAEFANKPTQSAVEFLNYIRDNNGQLVTKQHLYKKIPEDYGFFEAKQPPENNVASTGGKKSQRNKRTKRIKRTKIVKVIKSKLSKRAIKNNTVKRRSRRLYNRMSMKGGVNLDEFERIMVELDKTHKTKSLLVINI